jgi:type IV pilus assembly protein PilQ
MRTSTKAAGLLFLAAASVYSDQALGQSREKPATRQPASPLVTPLPDIVGAPAEVTPATAPAAVDPFAPSSPAAVPAATPVTTVTPVTPNDKPAAGVGASDVAYSAEQGTVEIHVNDAPLVEVLRMLSMQSQRNIIASKEVRGTVTANLYGVTVREALDAILHANGYAYVEKGNFVFVYTLKEIQEIERANRRVQTEVFRLFYTPAANAVNMIKPVMSEAGQVAFTTPAASGIESGPKDVGGNTHATEDVVVVTDYPENLEQVRRVLKEVDKRPQQILIEATILRAALTDDNALGVDFNILAGVNFSNILTNAGGQVTGASNTGNTSTGGAAAGAPVNNGGGGLGTGNNFSNIPGGLKFGFVSDNVSVFLSALEGVTDTTVLANPKVLALNKQKGEVIVGRKDGYLTSTVTESSTVQTVEFLETGTRLVFRPYIGDDGYIRMEIHPEDSSGGLTSNNLPFKITTEVTSNIMVRDGNTIVIGGLFRESSTVSKQQVPLLGSIPYAGTLFRQQKDSTVREEIIILLTPHIIKDDSAYSKLSEEQLKHGEMLRVGVRQGMMISGRERLAESCYRSAQEELAKPDGKRDRAIWFLNSAINLNPKFAEAIRLRQELTGQQITASDNSSIRSFVRQAMLVDRPVAAPATQPVSDKPAVKVPVEHTSPVSTPATQPATRPSEVSTEAPATQPAFASSWFSSFKVWGSFKSAWAYLQGFGPAPVASARTRAEPKVVVTELPLNDPTDFIEPVSPAVNAADNK